MITIPNQSSIAEAWNEFEGDEGPMKPSSYQNRIVDVMEEWIKFTYMTRSRPNLTNRYSERKRNRRRTRQKSRRLRRHQSP